MSWFHVGCNVRVEYQGVKRKTDVDNNTDGNNKKDDRRRRYGN